MSFKVLLVMHCLPAVCRVAEIAQLLCFMLLIVYACIMSHDSCVTVAAAGPCRWLMTWTWAALPPPARASQELSWQDWPGERAGGGHTGGGFGD
jgi:hypothetical protein